MQSSRIDRRTATRSHAWLKLVVHVDAALRSPRLYAIATWCWICGKRLRARARFAPLLALSPRAYHLWMQREHEVAESEYCNKSPLIVALIDLRAGQGDAAATFRSLEAEGITGIPIGGTKFPTPAAAARAIDWRANAWLMPISAGDALAPGAVQAYRSAIATVAGKGSVPRLVYADDDVLDFRGRRTTPHFKPDWNSELFRHFDYLTFACIVRAEMQDLARLSGPNWPAQLTSQAIGSADAVHVRHILHHRSHRPMPRVPARLDSQGDFERGGLPKVSVIVPTRNRVDLLRTCLEGLAHTDYPDIEVIVVDNDSDDPEALAYLSGLDPQRYRVLHHPGVFNFSSINNRAARLATGKLLCFLNNDIEIQQRDWLSVMARQAMRNDVGAVGARLFYPNGRIQHAGVVLGIGGGAAHAHRLMHPDEEGYFRRHALPQFVSAVTAACLVVDREQFHAVGGFDEDNFAVAFNDTDLCMRLNRKGWQSFYEPRATLIHHESVSRGFDRDAEGAARLAGELEALKRLWGTGEKVDPFHHPELSPYSERFVVRL